MTFNEGDSLEGLAMRSSGAATGTRSPMPARSTSTTTGPTTRTTTSASADPRKSRSDDGIAVGELTLGRGSPGAPAPKARQHAKLGTATGPTGDVAERSHPFISALYVETNGAYFGLPGIEPWDEARDARRYTGPFPVVAHPPCQRWGRYWHGAPNKPNEYRLGEDNGCFAAALTSVRNYGGVLEHPAHSNAWRFFGLRTPPKTGGWVKADDFGGWTCHVEQGHYGHISRKATWIYAVGTDRPELKWGSSGQRIHPVALERYGYEKARRIGMMAMVGGKDKTRIRNATPPEFRDLLLIIAKSAYNN